MAVSRIAQAPHYAHPSLCAYGWADNLIFFRLLSVFTSIHYLYCCDCLDVDVTDTTHTPLGGALCNTY